MSDVCLHGLGGLVGLDALLRKKGRFKNIPGMAQLPGPQAQVLLPSLGVLLVLAVPLRRTGGHLQGHPRLGDDSVSQHLLALLEAGSQPGRKKVSCFSWLVSSHRQNKISPNHRTES